MSLKTEVIASMRKRQIYIDKYGPVAGGKLYHALQSQAAHAGVSARLRRKLDAISRGEPWPPARRRAEEMPLFPEVALGVLEGAEALN